MQQRKRACAVLLTPGWNTRQSENVRPCELWICQLSINRAELHKRPSSHLSLEKRPELQLIFPSSVLLPCTHQHLFPQCLESSKMASRRHLCPSISSSYLAREHGWNQNGTNIVLIDSARSRELVQALCHFKCASVTHCREFEYVCFWEVSP